MASTSEKKEKSLAEFVIIIALVAMLTSVFVNYFIKQESQLNETAFKTLAQTFMSKVSTIHAQWLMDKQPRIVKLASINNQDKQLVSVNKFGWVDAKHKPLVCEYIWQVIMESPMSVMKQPIVAFEVRNFTEQSVTKISLVCRYILSSGVYFDYNRLNGRVSSVLNTNNEK
ncbi:MAG: hypothetical protein JJV99_02100 [Colwellia sp.]|nr:hypothetical protein [Colwellia sp.]